MSAPDSVTRNVLDSIGIAKPRVSMIGIQPSVTAQATGWSEDLSHMSWSGPGQEPSRYEDEKRRSGLGRYQGGRQHEKTTAWRRDPTSCCTHLAEPPPPTNPDCKSVRRGAKPEWAGQPFPSRRPAGVVSPLQLCHGERSSQLAWPVRWDLPRYGSEQYFFFHTTFSHRQNLVCSRNN